MRGRSQNKELGKKNKRKRRRMNKGKVLKIKKIMNEMNRWIGE